jgi:hypothetical protein
MKDEHPSSVHRCQIPRYHVVTEIVEQRNHDRDLVESLCRNLHPRVLRPSMTLTTKGLSHGTEG